MADIKKTKDEALAIINAALTILDRFPKFDETNTNLSFSTSTNPFPFLMDLFKSTTGYNIFLKIISAFIATALPALEISVKGVLLSNIKNLLTCSLNPFITKELLLNGIVFDLRTLDLINMLSYCPLEKLGQYYYFGCDGFTYTDELVKAGDFNAFLWHTKNKSLRRQVWYGVNIIQSNLDSIVYEDEEGNSTICQKEPKGNPPGREETAKPTKCKKSDGIITIQYCERPSSLRNSEGTGVSYLQTPHNHCLQVFLGNVQDTNAEISRLETAIADKDKDIVEKEAEIEELQAELESIAIDLEELQKQYAEQIVDKEYYLSEYDSLTQEQGDLTSQIEGKQTEITNLVSEKLSLISQLKGQLANLDDPSNYRTYQQNYYYKHTLIEFNTDYVMSLKLFDSKTLATQLIDALTGCISIDLNLSYEQLLIKYETQKMVQSVIESDDSVVSDCFFTFTNADYDKMLQKAELTREGLYSMDTDNPTGARIDAESILNSLNTINAGSSKETVQTVIEGALTEISGMISDVNYEEKDKLNFDAQINFIENIMNNLAYVIVMSILSPKVYLVFAINLQILGQSTSFSLSDFIEKYRQMIVEMIRAVRDALIQYLVDELMKILADLAKEVAIKLTVEQAQYYMRLIRRLIDCFRSKRGDLDFNIDNVNYADILEEVGEPIDNEC